jgi:Kef-type K+ transport system membrane component KefB
VLVSFSPTVTIAVVTEARARGPLTELALAVVVLADLALILGFALVLQFMRTLTGLGAAEVGLVPYLSWDIFGSLALGAMVGALFAFYLRLVGREVTLVLLAMCVLLSAAGQAFHVEPLLSALAAGLVVENIAPPEGDALRHAVERGALPVLVVFFAAAGASLHVDALATFGPIALGLAALRMAGIWLGVRAGVARAGMGGPAPLLWMGLVSQAGVTLGLTIIVANEFADWGPRIQTLVVALIAIHELIGPILFRTALARAGEVGMMDVETDASAEGELQARPAAVS